MAHVHGMYARERVVWEGRLQIPGHTGRELRGVELVHRYLGQQAGLDEVDSSKEQKKGEEEEGKKG